MDFKVKCVFNGGTGNKSHFTVGKIYEVTKFGLRNNNGDFYTIWMGGRGENNFDKLKEWFSNHSWVGEFVFELVEDKKVFTKSDLKNGDVIVRRNGSVEIAIVDRNVFISKDGWNKLADVNNDLTDIYSDWDDEWDIVKVYRPKVCHQCQFETEDHGELVYDRERDTKPKKPLYNGKVVCTDLGGNVGLYTVGKIYQFKNGQLTANNGKPYPGSSKNNACTTEIHTIEDWNKWSTAKWIEIKE